MILQAVIAGSVAGLVVGVAAVVTWLRRDVYGNNDRHDLRPHALEHRGQTIRHHRRAEEAHAWAALTNRLNPEAAGQEFSLNRWLANLTEGGEAWLQA